METSGICKTEGKEFADKHCTVVEKVVSGVQKLTILSLLYMCTGNEQLSKWMADCGSQVSHSLIESLQMSKERGLK